MRKHNKKLILCISVVVSVLTSFALAGITANAEYDEYGNYYEPYYEPYYDSYEYDDYDDDNIVTDSYYVDDSEYVYDPYTDPDTGESETTEYEEPSESAESSKPESYPEMSVDSTELTSKDWEQLQESLNSTFHMNPSKSLVSNSDAAVFQDIKNNSDTPDDDTNDTWTYLAWGIGLIAVGTAVILILVWTSLRTKRKMRERAARYTKKNNMKDILSDENIQKKLNSKQNKDKK